MIKREMVTVLERKAGPDPEEEMGEDQVQEKESVKEGSLYQ